MHLIYRKRISFICISGVYQGYIRDTSGVYPTLSYPRTGGRIVDTIHSLSTMRPAMPPFKQTRSAPLAHWPFVRVHWPFAGRTALRRVSDLSQGDTNRAPFKGVGVGDIP